MRTNFSCCSVRVLMGVEEMSVLLLGWEGGIDARDTACLWGEGGIQVILYSNQQIQTVHIIMKANEKKCK